MYKLTCLMFGAFNVSGELQVNESEQLEKCLRLKSFSRIERFFSRE